MRATINLNHGDCMEAMAKMSDNQYDLAIVDPPYGIGILSQFKSAGFLETKSMFKQTKGIVKSDWDSAIPQKEYFTELLRVSKNAIIWGGNYFLDYLGSTKCMISWDKMNGTNNMADFEIAWTNLDSRCRRFNMHHFSSGYDEKIHICQKPTPLYRWILETFAKEGDKILDTHGGSMSIALACWDLKYDLDLWELDEDYYKAGKKRFEDYTAQGQFNF